MIGTRFDYVAPTDVPGCVAALDDDARVLAGGTWLVPEMDRGEAHPRRIVDLRRAGLGEVEEVPGGVQVGSMTTYSALLRSAEIATHVPILRLMAETVTGGWSIRNQGTVGGSAVAARPQSDVPAVLAVADTRVVIAGADGVVEMPIGDFFVDAMTTSLRATQVVVGFRIPSWAGWAAGYAKIKRGGSSWPIATASALLRCDDAGICTDARVALGGVGVVPIVVDVSAALVGTSLTDDDIAAAGSLAVATITRPWEDVLAPAAYRRAVAPAAVRRAIKTARLETAANRGEGTR